MATVEEGELLERLDDALGRSMRTSGIDVGARRRLVEDGRVARDLVRDGGDGGGLTGAQLAALEALILVDGTRPMLKVGDEGIDIASMGAEAGWRDALALETRLEETVRAVGRIFSPFDAQHTGTAWVAGPGLVATNAHVLLDVARPGRTSPGSWTFDGPFLVDFASGPGSGEEHAFRITGVETSTQVSLPADFDPEDVDFALLRVEERSRSGSRLPAPLVTSDLDAWGGPARPVYVVGFPTRPARADEGRAVPGPGTEHEAILDALLADVYGTKRLCPGRVLPPPPGHGSGANSFAHDASTLGGFSGSPVIAFHSSGSAVGVHVAGSPRLRNHANRLRAVGSLPPP